MICLSDASSGPTSVRKAGCIIVLLLGAVCLISTTAGSGVGLLNAEIGSSNAGCWGDDDSKPFLLSWIDNNDKS